MHVLFFYFTCQVLTLYAGKAHFSMNESCLEAQKQIHALKFEEADKTIQAELHRDPANLALPWLSESILFMKLFISEDPDLYRKSTKTWSETISRVQKENFNNAWYRMILSDMYIHRGLIRLKFGENISAGSDIQSAYRYLKENRKMFPSFLPDNKNYGLLSCAFSSVPARYQWLAKLTGFQGDMETGLKEIETYLNSDLNYKENILLKTESAFVYAMIQHHLNKNPARAWTVIEPYTRNYRKNLLENYMRATIAGYNGKNDEMIDILQSKPSYHNSWPFYYMDFLLGMAKMRRLDTDADVYFRIFTVKYKGSNYLKAAYRNLSWIYQIKGDQESAKTYYSLCRKNGCGHIDEDRQADREAGENICWPVELLKARLLYDGKYYKQSLAILEHVKEADLKHVRFILELNYRKARIYHETGMINQALPHYQACISTGKKQPYYYAAYAALQTGFIYEEQGNKKEAVRYYKLSKSGFPDNREYANSIEQKARAGIKRIGKI